MASTGLGLEIFLFNRSFSDQDINIELWVEQECLLVFFLENRVCWRVMRRQPRQVHKGSFFRSSFKISRSSSEFEQELYKVLVFKNFLSDLNASTKPNTGYLVKLPFVSLFLEPRQVSSGFHEKEPFMVCPKTYSNSWIRNDVLSEPKNLQTFIQFEFSLRSQQSFTSGFMQKVLELTREMYSIWTIKVGVERIPLRESDHLHVDLEVSSSKSDLRYKQTGIIRPKQELILS